MVWSWFWARVELVALLGHGEWCLVAWVVVGGSKGGWKGARNRAARCCPVF